jgi:hypothetical protein
MFYVRHHEDEVAVFNSKCQNVVLLNHIKKALNVSGNIDLLLQAADYKAATPIGAGEKGDTTYANTYLQFRGSYLLLQVQEDEEGTKEYTLLWKSKTDESDRVTAALEARLADDRKKAGGAKGKKK